MYVYPTENCTIKAAKGKRLPYLALNSNQKAYKLCLMGLHTISVQPSQGLYHKQVSGCRLGAQVASFVARPFRLASWELYCM